MTDSERLTNSLRPLQIETDKNIFVDLVVSDRRHRASAKSSKPKKCSRGFNR